MIALSISRGWRSRPVKEFSKQIINPRSKTAKERNKLVPQKGSCSSRRPIQEITFYFTVPACKLYFGIPLISFLFLEEPLRIGRGLRSHWNNTTWSGCPLHSAQPVRYGWWWRGGGCKGLTELLTVNWMVDIVISFIVIGWCKICSSNSNEHYRF